MDRFKFRIWDKENKIWLENGDCSLSMDGELTVLGIDAYGETVFCDSKNYLIEQCAGLKDKNGKLIYEGDLIKEPANKYPLEIYYDKGAWQTREYRKNGNNEQLLYVLINCYGVEVIGNIHENADLLGADR